MAYGGKMKVNLKLDQIRRETSFAWEESGIGTGCPKRLCYLCTWEISRLNWISPWATRSDLISGPDMKIVSQTMDPLRFLWNQINISIIETFLIITEQKKHLTEYISTWIYNLNLFLMRIHKLFTTHNLIKYHFSICSVISFYYSFLTTT